MRINIPSLILASATMAACGSPTTPTAATEHVAASPNLPRAPATLASPNPHQLIPESEGLLAEKKVQTVSTKGRSTGRGFFFKVGDEESKLKVSRENFIRSHALGGTIIGLGLSATAIPIVYSLSKDDNNGDNKENIIIGSVMFISSVAGGMLGAHVGSSSSLKMMPELHRAIASNDMSRVEAILNRPGEKVNLNEQDTFGNTPLHYFAYNSEPDYIKASDADITIKNNAGKTPMDILSPHQRNLIIDPNGKNYLGKALELGNEEKVAELIKKYPNLRVELEKDWIGPLSYNPSLNMMKELLERGANPNTQDMKGNSAIQSVFNGDKSRPDNSRILKLKLLLANGANPKQLNYYKQNSMHSLLQNVNEFASEKEALTTFHTLIDAMPKSSLNARDILGRTPLDYAYSLKNSKLTPEFVKLLRDRGANTRSGKEERVPIFLNQYRMRMMVDEVGFRHAAVEVGMGNGHEVHFSGKTTFSDFKSKPLGEYQPLQNLFTSKTLIGYVPKGKETLYAAKMHDIVTEMLPQFNDKSYSAFGNNCINFSEDLAIRMEQAGIAENIQFPRTPMRSLEFLSYFPNELQAIGLQEPELNDSNLGHLIRQKRVGNTIMTRVNFQAHEETTIRDLSFSKHLENGNSVFKVNGKIALDPKSLSAGDRVVIRWKVGDEKSFKFDNAKIDFKTGIAEMDLHFTEPIDKKFNLHFEYLKLNSNGFSMDSWSKADDTHSFWLQFNSIDSRVNYNLE